MPTIVAIGAHHDDVELRCGGTLAKYVSQGWTAVYVVATTTPHYFPWPEEVASETYRSNEEVIEIRKNEARRGAARLGVTDVHFFDFKSLYWYEEGSLNRRFFDGRDLTMEEFRYLTERLPGREFIMTASHCPAAVEFLRDFLTAKKADVILTHFPDDAHDEHYATASFVRAAALQLANTGHSIKLYAWEQGGMGNLTTSFAPTHFVDISETIDLKCEALMSFVSQFPDHDPKMFAERARSKAKAYGDMLGMKFAEPFMEFQIPPLSQMKPAMAPTYDASRAKRVLS